MTIDDVAVTHFRERARGSLRPPAILALRPSLPAPGLGEVTWQKEGRFSPSSDR
jgi:hypothetical protein